MEGIKGGGRVGISEEDVVVSDGMQCINHPHRKNPGGICAFCLQEKLGKLVSSSFPLPIIPTASSSSSSPSSPSFRSNITLPTSSSSLPPKNNATISNNHNHNHNHNMRYRLPFLLPKKKKKKPSSMNPSSSSSSSDVVLKRSKSTATPRRIHFLDDNNAEDDNFSPRKRNGFWSFLYLSSSSTTKPSPSCSKKLEAKSFRESNTSPRISTVKPRVGSSLGRKNDIVFEEEEEEEEEESGCGSLEQRRVSRSRSVGCGGGGSRSFSGDFFERISTGFGDCTLRRVESQREGGNNKVGVAAAVGNIQNCMKERVRCGGIFGGFMMMTSSSSAASSSSSSSYWVSSDGVNDGRGSRSSSSWGWALASPIRAFTKNSSKDHNKRGTASQKNTTPNLSAVPSLLTVRS